MQHNLLTSIHRSLGPALHAPIHPAANYANTQGHMLV
jgi:hypothetical protein